MKEMINLEGPDLGFDWETAKQAQEALAESGGENIGAAMFADPGCIKCPGCAAFLWHTAYGFAGCPECGHTWDSAKLRCRKCCKPMSASTVRPCVDGSQCESRRVPVPR